MVFVRVEVSQIRMKDVLSTYTPWTQTQMFGIISPV